MKIYQLYEGEKERFTETFEADRKPAEKLGKFANSRIFSSCVSRISFLFLLFADIGWFLLSFALLTAALIGVAITAGKLPFFHRLLKKAYLNIRRSLACGLGLVVGLISPPFGIMVACTYFLMYDKKGIDEVIPGPIRAQFKELFNSSQS